MLAAAEESMTYLSFTLLWGYNLRSWDWLTVNNVVEAGRTHILFLRHMTLLLDTVNNTQFLLSLNTLKIWLLNFTPTGIRAPAGPFVWLFPPLHSCLELTAGQTAPWSYLVILKLASALQISQMTDVWKWHLRVWQNNQKGTYLFPLNQENMLQQNKESRPRIDC